MSKVHVLLGHKCQRSMFCWDINVKGPCSVGAFECRDI